MIGYLTFMVKMFFLSSTLSGLNTFESNHDFQSFNTDTTRIAKPIINTVVGDTMNIITQGSSNTILIDSTKIKSPSKLKGIGWPEDGETHQVGNENEIEIQNGKTISGKRNKIIVSQNGNTNNVKITSEPSRIKD